MNWEANSFMGVDYETESAFTHLTQEELIGLAYLKHTRDFVIKKGFSYLASFDGRHRSGKSLASITFAHLWDPTFYKYFESRIVQDHNEFMNAIQNLADEDIKGGCIVVDEAGVSMGSDQYWETWLRTLTKTVQMFGFLLPVIEFVSPQKDFVDSRLRKMFHSYYKVDRNNNNYSTITPYNLKFSSMKSKWYYKKPVVRLGNTEIVINRIKLHKPPQQLIERYRNLEQARKKVMLEKFMDEMRKTDAKSERTEVDLEKLIDGVVKNFRLYESKRSKPDRILLDTNKIQFRLKITGRMANYVQGEAERKLDESLRQMKKEVGIVEQTK